MQILWLICWSFGLLNAKISDCNQIFNFKNCIFIFQSTIDSIYLSYLIVINDDPMSFFKRAFLTISVFWIFLLVLTGSLNLFSFGFVKKIWSITVNMGNSNYIILFIIIIIITIDNLHLFIYCLSSAQKRASQLSCNFP